MNDRDKRSAALVILGGVLLGVATGAVTGLLLAPGSGSKTRSDIEDAGDRLRGKTEAALGELRTSVEELVTSTKQYVEDTRARMDASIEAGKQAAAETKEQLSTVVEKQTGQSL
ncbi:MAG: YtxH domain-containing protein [Armatimonadota bacterium]|nr:YtxH domain-containing protein [Armatimonadota bacterium]